MSISHRNLHPIYQLVFLHKSSVYTSLAVSFFPIKFAPYCALYKNNTASQERQRANMNGKRLKAIYFNGYRI
jgi:hypothetical protein